MLDRGVMKHEQLENETKAILKRYKVLQEYMIHRIDWLQSAPQPPPTEHALQDTTQSIDDQLGAMLVVVRKINEDHLKQMTKLQEILLKIEESNKQVARQISLLPSTSMPAPQPQQQQQPLQLPLQPPPPPQPQPQQQPQQQQQKRQEDINLERQSAIQKSAMIEQYLKDQKKLVVESTIPDFDAPPPPPPTKKSPMKIPQKEQTNEAASGNDDIKSYVQSLLEQKPDSVHRSLLKKDPLEIAIQDDETDEQTKRSNTRNNRSRVNPGKGNNNNRRPQRRNTKRGNRRDDRDDDDNNNDDDDDNASTMS
jgi:hypothetical protein